VYVQVRQKGSVENTDDTATEGILRSIRVT
jgi:hypothetical protein